MEHIIPNLSLIGAGIRYSRTCPAIDILPHSCIN